MATEKKAATKAGKKKHKKNLAGGDPIIIGPGSGKKLVGGTTIQFNPGWYNNNNNPRKPNQHSHAGDKLGGLSIKVGGSKMTSPVNSTSKLEIWCRQPPATTGSPVVWIDGTNMTIDFSNDFVKQRPGLFYCSYLIVSEVIVDGQTRFTSNDGDCEITSDDTGSTTKKKSKPKGKA